MLLPIFCLRVAAGLAGCLLLLSPGSRRGGRALVQERFFRTQFLIILGFACLAALFLRQHPWPLLAAGSATVCAFLGYLAWSLEGAPAGTSLIILTLGVALSALGLAETSAASPASSPTLALLGGASSALLLGAALSAMLMGHSYLIAPAMSISPLKRLLGALAVALVVRAAVDGYALVRWTGGHSLGNLEGDTALWLPVRWGVGFVAPAILTWMAVQTARIRSTQSATGILYVVVIFCFLGELTGQLLRETGTTL